MQRAHLASTRTGYLEFVVLHRLSEEEGVRRGGALGQQDLRPVGAELTAGWGRKGDTNTSTKQ